jgi:pimeloyl-ACP methyl ester carboxylesterase
VLIVQGHQDPIGQKPVEEIHSLIKSSTLRYIPRCGHYPWAEQPDLLRTALAEFLTLK